MKIKKFTAASMNQAFQKIKAELGPDAVVLNVREIKRTNKWGMVQGKYLEVTAAVDEGLPRTEKVGTAAQPQSEKMFETYGRPRMRPQRNGEQNDVAILRKELADLRQQMNQMRLGASSASATMPVSAALLPKFQTLVESGVPEALARQIVRSVETERDFGMSGEEKLLREVAGFFSVPETPLSQNNGPKIVALIGPTGVGKTTTIAKLAATDRVKHHKEVGLVSMDTYRIAAVEQLRVFADLAKIPMEVAYKPEHMVAARRKFSSKEVIYIDTPGRSPRDEQAIAEMARYLQAIQPDEIHLVLNLSTRPSDLLKAIKQFQTIPINRILFTKLDETDQYGAMLDVVQSLSVPISYITYGQDVPETFREATRPYLSRLILGMETIV